MRMLGREGYLLFFDELDDRFAVGNYLSTNEGAMKIVYVDRENGEIGCLPASKRMQKKIARVRRDSFGAGDA